MSADLLRRAAAKLRAAAIEAAPPPWVAHPDGLVWPPRMGDPVSGSTDQEDADYIALVHPPVALALADWLDSATYDEYMGDEDHTRHALAVARAVLREPGDTP